MEQVNLKSELLAFSTKTITGSLKMVNIFVSSLLYDQFMIRRNYAKSFQGFKARNLAKITALTLVQYINKFIFNRPINNIKIQIT